MPVSKSVRRKGGHPYVLNPGATFPSSKSGNYLVGPQGPAVSSWCSGGAAEATSALQPSSSADLLRLNFAENLMLLRTMRRKPNFLPTLNAVPAQLILSPLHQPDAAGDDAAGCPPYS